MKQLGNFHIIHCFILLDELDSPRKMWIHSKFFSSRVGRLPSPYAQMWQEIPTHHLSWSTLLLFLEWHCLCKGVYICPGIRCALPTACVSPDVLSRLRLSHLACGSAAGVEVKCSKLCASPLSEVAGFLLAFFVHFYNTKRTWILTQEWEAGWEEMFKSFPDVLAQWAKWSCWAAALQASPPSPNKFSFYES